MEHSEYLCTFWEDDDSFHHEYYKVVSSSKNNKWKKAYYVVHLKSRDDDPDDIEVVTEICRLLKKDIVSFKLSGNVYVRNDAYQLFLGADIDYTHQSILKDYLYVEEGVNL
jgi:hypothetical protein